jgi:dTDP-4-amino-4,6-dideoxygalactose transaminase
MPTLALDGGTPAIQTPLPGGGFGVELIDDEEVAAITAVLQSKRLFRYGTDTESNLLETEVAAWQGVRYALFVNSGTSALICALTGLGIGPGDEVIVPAYTYIATAAAVVAVGAVPILAEIDDSLGLDPADVAAKITPQTRAILPVHMQGVPCRLATLRALADVHGLALIEDCCQAIGAEYEGRRAGTWGKAGAWSLNYFKAITCGEGGVVFTDDPALIERARFQADPALPMWSDGTQEWLSAPFSRECYRGNEMAAAMARVQLRKLPRVLAHCRALKTDLLARLAPPRAYALQHVDDPSGDLGISFAMLAHTPELAQRLAAALQAEGLHVGSAYSKQGFPDRHIFAYWDSIMQRTGASPAGYPWRDPAYRGQATYSPDMCPRTLDLLGRALRLPLHLKLTVEHTAQIAAAINKVDAAL